jgi:general secretion pathway protein K
MPCCKKVNQRGVALLMAMLVVALATVTAVSLVHEQSLSMRKTGHIQATENALMYSLGLEDYARLFLQKDSANSKIDHLQEDWAIGIPALPIDGGFLSGALQDEQSKINLNAIVEKEVEDRLRVLCNNLDVSPVFISALKDWVDSDQDTVDADGAEDDYYTALEQPYRAANRNLTDLSELLLVKGVDREMFEIIAPFVTVLPTPTGLNLNTIPAEIYKTLDTGLDAEKFIAERGEDAFGSLNDYKTRMDHPALIEKGLTVSTEYFLATGQITIGEKTLLVETLIHRDSNGATRVLSRTLGGS